MERGCWEVPAAVDHEFGPPAVQCEPEELRTWVFSPVQKHSKKNLLKRLSEGAFRAKAMGRKAGQVGIEAAPSYSWGRNDWLLRNQQSLTLPSPPW